MFQQYGHFEQIWNKTAFDAPEANAPKAQEVHRGAQQCISEDIAFPQLSDTLHFAFLSYLFAWYWDMPLMKVLANVLPL